MQNYGAGAQNQNVPRTVTEAARSTQIHEAVGSLEARLNGVMDVAQTLVARLSCVSMSHPPKPETAGGLARQQLCPLAERLDNLARQAELIGEQLSDQIGRLEL